MPSCPQAGRPAARRHRTRPPQQPARQHVTLRNLQQLPSLQPNPLPELDKSLLRWWLDGAAAEAFTCDASVTPVVTADVDLAALDDLVRLCTQLDKLHHGDDGSTSSDSDGPAAPEPAAAGPAAPAPGAPGPGAARAREALEQAIIGKTINLLQLSLSTFDLRRLLVWSGADAVAFSGVRSGSQFCPGFPCGPLHCGDHDRVPRFRLPRFEPGHSCVLASAGSWAGPWHTAAR